MTQDPMENFNHCVRHYATIKGKSRTATVLATASYDVRVGAATVHGRQSSSNSQTLDMPLLLLGCICQGCHRQEEAE